MCLLCVAQGGAVQHKCVLSGVQKGQIAHLGRQKPPESELAVAAHGGASQRHTTGAVYGRLRTSWDGDGPCGLNSSVGGHTVQNKTNKQNNNVAAVVGSRVELSNGAWGTLEASFAVLPEARST